MPDALAPPANDALPLQNRSELRFLTCGSVDDGKSTLIGPLIAVDDERMRFRDGEMTTKRRVRFRTLGCWPLTGAIASRADDVTGVIAELLDARSSERQGRLVDGALQASMERKKREGYF